jgi:hypothetical protein
VDDCPNHVEAVDDINLVRNPEMKDGEQQRMTNFEICRFHGFGNTHYQFHKSARLIESNNYALYRVARADACRQRRVTDIKDERWLPSSVAHLTEQGGVSRLLAK